MICGALSWLRDFEEKKKLEEARLLASNISGTDAEDELKKSNTKPLASQLMTNEPDWIKQFVQEKKEQEMIHRLKVKISCLLVCLYSILMMYSLIQIEKNVLVTLAPL